MAVRTLQKRVGTQQGKAILMLLDPLGLDIPAFHRVTLLTIGAKLAAVDIRVAIRAARADVREDKIGMALVAIHFLVHAAQRVARQVVIKLRNTADGFPTRIRVAVLARDVDGAVGVATGLFVGLRLRGRLPDGRNGQEQEQEPSESSRIHGRRAPFDSSIVGRAANGWAGGEWLGWRKYYRKRLCLPAKRGNWPKGQNKFSGPLAPMIAV